ncbi:hypothetical protein HNR46_003645 [Haloferula luteola]|uniref:Uncharacterized protein n=1 Tax=Haloferula luteola TaxID=595692 RepID=A0A840VFJ3_9BACT|nr:hypothetical protein [Haloferula luteola]MBB5353388.1 hypothetical protein [Haloferula luteola]
MKVSKVTTALVFAMFLGGVAGAQTYTNFIRQVQVNSGAEWEVPVEKAGEQLSPLAIDPGGARFELWTVRSSTLTEYLLDQRYVGSYVPQAFVEVESEDPYVTVHRTRADRPFTFRVSLSGLLTDPSAPEASRKVRLLHYLQEYGADGNEATINRDEATLAEDAVLEEDGAFSYYYPLSTLPGEDRSKLRGEETLTVSTLRDYQGEDYDIPPYQVASVRLQVWPVADGAIVGIEEGQSLRFETPQIQLILNDLYPDSRTFAQLYQGPANLGQEGEPIPGSAIVINDAVPNSRVLVLDHWDSLIKDSGEWTMEILTQTPFGVDRLAHVTFTIDRDIKVNGTVTTIE